MSYIKHLFLTTTAISKATYQPESMEWTDAEIIQLLKRRDGSGFELVFKHYFKNLYKYALAILREHDQAEEIVQNVFVKLWEKKEELEIRENMDNYLYRAVHNESLNYLKHLKVRSAYQAFIMRRPPPHAPDNLPEKITLSELERRLEKAILELPEQCRLIFRLSRSEELRYKEIADKLSLSVKTVENQMGKALKLLRMKLADFLPLIIIILIILYKAH